MKMSSIIPTLIWYYYICPREVWLMAHEINPEQDNPLMELGRIFHEYFITRKPFPNCVCRIPMRD